MDSKNLLTTLMITGLLMLGFWYFFGRNTDNTSNVEYALYKGLPVQPLATEKNDKGEDARPQRIVLGWAKKGDKAKLGVTVDNELAGIDLVQFNVDDYAATFKHDEPLVLFPDHNQTDPYVVRPFATIGVHITVGNDTHELPVGIHAPNESAETTARVNQSNLLDVKYVWRWDQARNTATDAYCYATIKWGDINAVRITKHFHLDPDSYEITITHTIENLLPDKTIHVAIDQLTTPALARDDPQTDDRFFHATALKSASGGKMYVDGDHGYNMTWNNLRKAAESLKDSTTGNAKDPGTEYVGGMKAQFDDFSDSPELWVAASNRFFAAIIRPKAEVPLRPATAQDVEQKKAPAVGAMIPATDALPYVQLQNDHTIPKATHVAQANIDLMSIASKPADDQAIVRLTGHALEIAPGKAVDEPLSVFLGPKKRDLLQGETSAGGKPAYADYQYIKLLQFNTCVVYSFCFIDQVGMVILWLLDFLRSHVAFGNYGVAIMILVIAVRALLHPLTRASQINMAKMGKQMRDIQPKLEAIKKRYPDDKRKQSEEQMRVYRENNINPAGGIMGCLPMALQAPIWVALYSALRGDVDLRHSVFIPGWINDLAGPDKILPAGSLVLGHPVFSLPLVGDVYGLNLLPLLVAAVFFFQMKVTGATQPKPADAQQAQMQKMSQYMVFIFPVMLYNAPSGLNLYIFASTLAGLVDTYFVRKALRKQGILASNASLLPTHEDADGEKK